MKRLIESTAHGAQHRAGAPHSVRDCSPDFKSQPRWRQGSPAWTGEGNTPKEGANPVLS